MGVVKNSIRQLFALNIVISRKFTIYDAAVRRNAFNTKNVLLKIKFSDGVVIRRVLSIAQFFSKTSTKRFEQRNEQRNIIKSSYSRLWNRVSSV